MKIVYVTQQQRIVGDKLDYFNRLLSDQPDGLIIREKYLSDDMLAEFAEPIIKLGIKYNVPIILRGKPRLARELGVTHLQLSYAEAMGMELPDDFKSIGVSVHQLSEAIEAEKHGASRVTYGHIFASPCKPDLPPRGIVALDEIVQACKIPVYAIGGITLETLPFLLPVNIAGSCLMSASMTDSHPETLTTRIRKLIERSK